jgi:hypothetical protein
MTAIDFVGCLFWDLTLIYTFGNALYIGQDVLQLGGILTFTGCTFFENTVFGVENGLGLVSITYKQKVLALSPFQMLAAFLS